MPYAQNEDIRVTELVSHLVIAYEQPTNLARRELKKLLPDPGIRHQDIRRRNQGFQHPLGRLLILRGKKSSETLQVGQGLARPA